MPIATGTTMSHVFTVSVDLTGAEVMYITYQQQGKTVLEKDLSDCVITPESITVNLRQEDTLGFIDNLGVKIQIRVRMPDGSALKSEVIKTTADELLKEGVI